MSSYHNLDSCQLVATDIVHSVTSLRSKNVAAKTEVDTLVF